MPSHRRTTNGERKKFYIALCISQRESCRCGILIIRLESKAVAPESGEPAALQGRLLPITLGEFLKALIPPQSGEVRAGVECLEIAEAGVEGALHGGEGLLVVAAGGIGCR